MEEETKMPDEFYDWLDECPVGNWVREKVVEEGIVYFFPFPCSKTR